ncbi:substrate-binding periplasmic protein [Candidatus Pelagadaptatus aseana]|uniref:substrate-binding periplasmic protein n=1 Tax=Candidatus Pelagadaptatus aseana TaxID=3120508 RepID=UPI003C6EC255
MRYLQLALVVIGSCLFAVSAPATATKASPADATACSFQTFATSNPETLHVGYFELPPYAVTGTNGSVTGIWADYFKELLGRSGIQYTEAMYPPNRLARKAFTGQVDITLVANNILLTEGQKTVIFLPTPAMTMNLGLISLKHSPVLSIEAMQGKNLGVNRGYGYGGYIHQLKQPDIQLNLWPEDSEVQLIKMVLSQRLESALLYESVWESPPKHWQVNTDPLHFEPLKKSNFHIAINRQIDNVESLQRVLIHNMGLFDKNLKLKPCIKQ